MKTKKILRAILLILLTALMSVSLSACLKIGMKRDNLISRLEKAGASVTYERSTPMTEAGQRNYRLDDILLAKVQIDGEERHVYVIYCGDDRSGDWVESQFKASKEDEVYADWLVYRYDNVVMFGYFKAVAIARNY